MIASRMKLYEFLYNVWENKGSPFQLPSIQWVPMQHPSVGRGALCIFSMELFLQWSTLLNIMPTIYTSLIGGVRQRRCRRCRSWKNHWRTINNNRRWPQKCQLKLRKRVVDPNSNSNNWVNCNNDAKVGMHIFKRNARGQTQYIVPGCYSCNRRGTRQNRVEFQLKNGAHPISAVQCTN